MSFSTYLKCIPVAAAGLMDSSSVQYFIIDLSNRIAFDLESWSETCANEFYDQQIIVLGSGFFQLVVQ